MHYEISRRNIIMKKIILTSILLLLVTLSFAQESATVRPGGADVAFAARNYKLAEQICLVELEANPRNFNSWFYLCQSLLQQGLYSRTIANSNTAAQYFPRSASTFREISAAAHYYSGNRDVAMEQYQFAIKNAPDSTFRRAVTWYHVGLIYLSQEKFHKAVPALKSAITANPWNLQWQERYGYALEKANLKNEAITFYRSYLNKKELSEELRKVVEQRLNLLAPPTTIQMTTEDEAA